MDERYSQRRPRRKTRAGVYFARSLELLAIALAYLEKSRLMRFVTAKLSMSTVVEVTARFGRGAGHRLSTFLSLIVAEPRILAVMITAILLIVNLVVWLVGLVRTQPGRQHRRSGFAPADAVSPNYEADMPAFLRSEPVPADGSEPGPAPAASRGRLSPLLFILCLALVSALFFFLS